MVTPLIAVVVMILGVLMYFVAGNPKVAEVGRIMFLVGLAATLFAVGSMRL